MAVEVYEAEALGSSSGKSDLFEKLVSSMISECLVVYDFLLMISDTGNIFFKKMYMIQCIIYCYNIISKIFIMGT